MCGKTRHAVGLLKHCLDKHNGQVPIVVHADKAADYEAAATVLRKAKFKVTVIAMRAVAGGLAASLTLAPLAAKYTGMGAQIHDPHKVEIHYPAGR
jgi:hypothetical protein